nr:MULTISPECIES: pyruvate kinase [Bradyrhizobium]
MGDTLRRSRHAKIVATVGPASAEPEKIRALYLSGVDTFRLNSRNPRRPRKSYVCIRELEPEFVRPIGILQDLLRAGETVRLVIDGAKGAKQSISLPHPEILKATAIHVFCVQGKLKGERFARYWYDIVRLDDAKIAEAALKDRKLAEMVAEHKTWC